MAVFINGKPLSEIQRKMDEVDQLNIENEKKTEQLEASKEEITEVHSSILDSKEDPEVPVNSSDDVYSFIAFMTNQ